MAHRKKYPLQIHIATVFIALVAILGLVLTIFSYQNARVLQEHLATELTEKNAHQLRTTFEKLTLPVLTTLDTLALAPFIADNESGKRKAWLSAIQAVMDRNPEVVSIYYGREDESSYFVRSTVKAFMKRQFDAPQQSVLMMDVNSPDGKRIRRFFDSELSLLSELVESDVDYKPTTRPWYQVAPENGAVNITEPYMYYFIKRLGITLSRRTLDGNGVLAADFTLKSLSDLLASIRPSNDAHLGLFDSDKRLIAHSGFVDTPPASNVMAGDLIGSPLASLESRALSLSEWLQETDGEHWQVNLVPVQLGEERFLWLAEAIPERELLASAIKARDKQTLITLGAVVMSTILVLWAARAISRPLRVLSETAKRLREFDFSDPSCPRSRIREVDVLGRSVEQLALTLRDFLAILREVTVSSDFDTLLARVAAHCRKETLADQVVLWTSESQDRSTFVQSAKDGDIDREFQIEKLLLEHPDMAERLVSRRYLCLSEPELELLDSSPEKALHSGWLFALVNRDGELVGVVLLGFMEKLRKMQLDKLKLISEFLSFAELTKENLDRIAQQKGLFNSFIELIASAIDTKSPYTGGHCQRVPELTFMLAEAAHRDQQYFPGFRLTSEDREALHVAAWLHDCGKVTTPEYVVDKATKLQTIHDRIHEVRMRFEVKKNEVEIRFWQDVANGGNRIELEQVRNRAWQELDDEFAFIAKCNIGSEFMDDRDVARLERIAQRTWTRTIDDAQGLSWEEMARREQRGKATLPCEEPLLSDREEHKIEWGGRLPSEWEFTMEVPSHRFNRGELHNLKIRRGTLSDEERFVINNHIVQTILMLRKLPYPRPCNGCRTLLVVTMRKWTAQAIRSDCQKMSCLSMPGQWRLRTSLKR